jgi:hypothetical protein
MAGLALHRNMLVAELASHRDGLGEPFEGRIALNHSRRHDRDIVGDQARIAMAQGAIAAIGPEPSGGYERGIIRILLAAGFSVRRINPNRATSSAQPAASLLTQKPRPQGRIARSKRSIETSIPTL